MKTKIHQINETHIGDICTPDEAKEVAAVLTKIGYPSEYTSMQGVRSSVTDDETGDEIEIPQDAWDEALSTLHSDLRHNANLPS